MKRTRSMRLLSLVMALVCIMAPAVSLSLESNCECAKDSPCSSDGYICLCCVKGAASIEDDSMNTAHSSHDMHAARETKTPSPCYAQISHCGGGLEVMAETLPAGALEIILFVQEGPGPLLSVIEVYDDSARPGFRLPEDPPPVAVTKAIS